MPSYDPIMVVPFATGYYNTLTTSYSPNKTGVSEVLLTTFGYATSVNLGNGFDIASNTPRTFVSSSGQSGGYAFAAATQITRVNIFAEVYTEDSITNSYNLTPYVALAIADPWSDLFTIVPETITPITTRTAFDPQGIYSTSKEDIIVSIPSGSRIMIVCGHTNDSLSSRSSTSGINFSGGIAFW